MPTPESQLDLVSALDIAILEKITNDPNIGTMVSGAVYPGFANTGQTYPYVEYQYIRGGELNDSPRTEVDIEYLIVGKSDDYLTAIRLAAYIYNAMTQTQLPMPVPYRAHWVSRDNLYNRKKAISNSYEFTIGAYYGIKAHVAGDIDRRIISYGS
jgi:hypothetical protein